MKKLFLFAAVVILFVGCGKQNNESTPWDNTNWNFTGIIDATSGNPSGEDYTVQFKNGFTLNIINAKSGNFTSDWFAGSTMELNNNGDLRLYYNHSDTQVIETGDGSFSFSVTFSEEMVISRVDEQHAKGYFSHSQTTSLDGEESSFYFSGILTGTRIDK